MALQMAFNERQVSIPTQCLSVNGRGWGPDRHSQRPTEHAAGKGLRSSDRCSYGHLPHRPVVQNPFDHLRQLDRHQIAAEGPTAMARLNLSSRRSALVAKLVASAKATELEQR